LGTITLDFSGFPGEIPKGLRLMICFRFMGAERSFRWVTTSAFVGTYAGCAVNKLGECIGLFLSIEKVWSGGIRIEPARENDT